MDLILTLSLGKEPITTLILWALRLLPDDLLLPAQGPLNAPGSQSDSFQEVMCQLKKMALASVVAAKEKQKILDFAII